MQKLRRQAAGTYCAHPSRRPRSGAIWRTDKDQLAAYDNHADSYVQKPVDYDEFVAAAR
jgi:hypothetical protein